MGHLGSVAHPAAGANSSAQSGARATGIVNITWPLSENREFLFSGASVVEAARQFFVACTEPPLAGVGGFIFTGIFDPVNFLRIAPSVVRLMFFLVLYA